MDEGEGHRVEHRGLVISQRGDCIVTFDEREVRPLGFGNRQAKMPVGHRQSLLAHGAADLTDGQLIAAAHPGPGEGFLKVWEASTGRKNTVSQSFPETIRQVRDVHYLTDGSFLFSWGDDSPLFAQVGRAEALIVTPGQLWAGSVKFHHAWVRNPLLLLDSNGDLHASDHICPRQEAPVVKIGFP